MAVTTFWYGVPVKNVFAGTANGVWDWDTDTIKVALTTSSYVPNQDTHDFFNDITNELTTTGGYTAGGQTITTPTVTYDTATNETRLDADDPSWTSASFTARYAVWYKSTGVAANSPVIGYMDFGADQTVSSGTFTITLNSSGAFKATAS
jgi:hypothetical protein